MPLILFCLTLYSSVSAATLPPGFTETQIASDLSAPTAMAIAPDGRLFVCEQGGSLRVIKNGVLSPTPFVTVSVESSNDRGLLGVAFDPNFSTNQYVYVSYTASSPTIHNRVSRFTANGDVAEQGSETIILELNNLSLNSNHVGGAIHFGLDGKLYIATGDDNNSSTSQTLANLFGKILRLNPDGSIPADNPFFDTATGNNRAIWTLGLRNPFTFAVQPGTGKTFINDVGEDAWEEINEGSAGANYGWPATEGYTFDPRFSGPVFAYGHGTGDTLGCAIVGGAFYNPDVIQFPSEYIGVYFFADLCNGWIRTIDPANGNLISEFATGISYPVDLQVDQNGSLYYLARGSSSVYRISYAATAAPLITRQPRNQFVSQGQPATFSVNASGAEPLSYQWQRDGADINGATSPVYQILSTVAADDGARFRCIVSNSFGIATSNSAILSFNANRLPSANITAPADGALYRGGDLISFSGVGADPEDGELPASAFTWQIDFYRDTYVQPFMPPTSGMKAGSFSIPTAGETSPKVWFRITLTVRDSDGLTQTIYRDLKPQKSITSVRTAPAGLTVKLDGAPLVAPFSFEGVVGVARTIGSASPQMLNGANYLFSSWSDGGAATHDVITPAVDTTLTATFVSAAGSGQSIVQFSQANYGVNEGDGYVAIKVSRTGSLESDTTVDYTTRDGTALEQSDYTTARGTLHFATGEAEKSFNVLVTDDSYVEGDETINLELSNPGANAALGTQTTAQLTIVDNDTEPSTTNPIDDARFFIRQHYHDFLNREPDQSGWDYWTEQITACGSDVNCVRSRRLGVSAAYFTEREFQDAGAFIYLLYQACYARVPLYSEFMFDHGNVRAGPNLEADKSVFLNSWVLRPEFLRKYPADMSGAQFVDELLATVLLTSRVDLSTERDALIEDYDTSGRATVLREVVNNFSFAAAEYNSAFVLMEYFGYLRRDPDAEGYQFWLDVLNNRVPSGSPGYRAMVCAFITSIEYQNRFNSIYTHHDSECEP